MRRNALFLILFLALPLRADWPQWRGRDRDGVAHGTKLPKSWPANPPEPAWKQPVGEGQSSPVVAGHRLFVLGRQGGQEVCWALDARTGKVLWQYAYDCVYTPADKNAGQGPKSTPTVDGNRVFMLGVAGMLHCFDTATGRVVWKHDLRKQYWGVEKDQWGDDAYWPCCGAATSPLVDGERVIVSVGGKKAGAMTAFDRRTGKVVWKSPVSDRASYGSPILGTLQGVRQLVGFTGTRMAGLRREDGRLIWGHPFQAQYEQTVLTPVVWKDHVLVGGEKKPTVALKVRREGLKFVASEAWSNDQLRITYSSPVMFRDHVVGVTFRKQLVCVDLATGKTAWVSGVSGSHASIVRAGDWLLVLTEDAELFIFEASLVGVVRKARWRVSDSGSTWSHLAVVGTRIYVKDKNDVLCFDLAAP